MAAGLTDKLLSMSDLAEIVDAAPPKPAKRGIKRKRPRMTIWRALQLSGLTFLIVVVLAHVAESFQIFPAMGWGKPATAGHYLDLMSAVLGCTLLSLGSLEARLSGERDQSRWNGASTGNDEAAN